MSHFPPAPRDKEINSVRWRDWLEKVRQEISGAVNLFTGLDFTGSNITSIVSRDHNDLTSKQGGSAGQFFHLTQTQHDNFDTNVTGSVDAHSDVDTSAKVNGYVLTYNSTSGNWEAAAPTGGGGTDHGTLVGLGDDDHTQYHTDARALTWLGTRTTDDLPVGTTNKYNATHTGDVTGATALTIANDAVTNAKLSNMATSTIKGRSTAGTGDPEDLTATQVRTIINVANGATANSSDAVLLARANHTGTQLASTISDFDTEVSNNTDVAANTSARHTHANQTVLDNTTASFTTADETKLDGIATGATANSSDATLLARANHTGTQTMSTISDLPTLAAGTYTPTLFNVTNVSASTAYQCQYMRLGATVTVSGKVDLTGTSISTASELGISIPVASNFGATEDCAGTALESSAGAISSQGGALLADITNNRAALKFTAVSTSSRTLYFTFTYQVI